MRSRAGVGVGETTNDAGGGAEAPVRWWAASCVVGSAHGWLGAVGFVGAQAWRPPAGTTTGGALAAPVPVAFPVLASSAAPCWAVWSTGWETRRATATARLETFENRHAGTRPTGLARPPAGGDRAMRQRRHPVYGGLAGAHPGTAPAACAAGGRHRAGSEELGGTGVRRRAAGGCASERAPGDLRPAPGGSADAGVHGRREGGSSLDQGLLPFHRQADNEAVTVENILQSHRYQTLRRMQGEKTVLCCRTAVPSRSGGWGLPTRPAPRPAVCTSR